MELLCCEERRLVGRDLNLPARVSVMGAPIDPWTMEQTVDAVDWFVRRGTFAHAIGVNADKLLQMRDDPMMDSTVRRCEIVNADGASMVMAAERFDVEVPERVAGIDLIAELCSLAECKGYSVYLLGAVDSVVRKAAEVVRERYPGIVVAGCRDGYFGEDEFDSVVEETLAKAPQIVFVGITSPKKEKLIERFREKGAEAVFVGVGGSFDVISGKIPRAPLWMQRANLEWLFRMAHEPKRLVKRYMVGNARFYEVLRSELREKKRG